MSSYDFFIENKPQLHDQDYLEDLEEMFQYQARPFDNDYQQNKDEAFKRTKQSEKEQGEVSHSTNSVNFIDVSKDALKIYIHSKKGRSKQTMELLPNFKTFVVRKIKELLLIKVLNKKQKTNCINFIKSKPSFQAFGLLFSPIQRCQQLRIYLLDLFTSSQIIRCVMESRIRLSQKQKMIKFIEQIRKKLNNPRTNSKWKQWYI